MSDAAEILTELTFDTYASTDILDALMGDADHVHLARQVDGTVTATPMRPITTKEPAGDVGGVAVWRHRQAWVDEVSS